MDYVGQGQGHFEAHEARLKALHRSIAMIVVNSTDVGDHVQGFVKKRSTRTNAEQHLGARVVLHADIKGFFDAIATQHVRSAFISEGAPVVIADLLARVCTIDGLLRQGTRCSPAVANLVCQELDQAFLRLARANACAYTRYADDITLSGDTVPPDESVREILESRGFSLRDGRCFRQFRGRCQFVTGLTVVDKTAPRLPRRLKRRLRLTMHYIERFGIADHFEHTREPNPIAEESWLGGILMYARSIEPGPVAKWQAILDEALSNRESYEQDAQSGPEDN